MSGVTFGRAAMEAFSKKMKKSRPAEDGCRKGKNSRITKLDCSHHTGAAAPEDGETTPRSSFLDMNRTFIQPNSFAGKRALAQLLRTYKQRPTTACPREQREQPNRPRWDRPPMFTFDTKPASAPTDILAGKLTCTTLTVTGSRVKMTVRTKPLLWLSLQVNWSKSGVAQKAALRRIYEFTRKRPFIGHSRHPHRRRHRSDSPRRRSPTHRSPTNRSPPNRSPTNRSPSNRSRSKSRKKSKPKPRAKRYTVACDFCTFINKVKRRDAVCRMCGAPLPDPETANNMDEVLPCGLTARQLFELQNREITAEDFEMLCILDEGVAKKTLDKASVEKFATSKVTKGGQDCGVCQCELEMGEEMTSLPCGHKFHTECINEWLLKYNNSCPYKCSWGGDAAAASASGR